jgi:MFS family permease
VSTGTLKRDGGAAAAAAAAAVEEAEVAAAAAAEAASLRHIWLVPYVLFASSLVVCVGSGMTVKFFPLFFGAGHGGCGMSPVGVQLVMAAAPLAQSVLAGAAQPAADRCGRVLVMTLLEALGVGMLALLAYLADSGAGIAPIVSVYLVRTALMNCTYALEDSILMDFVPPTTRARWQSLDSISSATWAGSAVLGGYLADRHGYTFTFYFTAGLQALAVAIRMTLLLIVPRYERRRPRHRKSAVRAAAAPPTEPPAATNTTQPSPPARTLDARSLRDCVGGRGAIGDARTPLLPSISDGGGRGDG